MARNLVICCDGTGNQFDSVNTNVVRIVQVINRDPAKQRLYYDPGVCTLPKPGAWGVTRQIASQLYGLAFGAGMMSKKGTISTGTFLDPRRTRLRAGALQRAGTKLHEESQKGFSFVPLRELRG